MESLRPDRDLLNHKFEGYKLSGNSLDVCSTTLLSAVSDVSLKDELLISFQHVRAFGNVNHLVLDSWTDGGKTEAVYFVDENYEVQRADVKYQEKEISCVETVFKIPSTEKAKECLNATLFFPSSSLACLSDGSGKLFLVFTEDRTKHLPNSDPWKVATVYQFEQPSLILHAIQNPETGSVSCLLLSISENDTSTSVKDAHIVHLELVTFSKVKGSSAVDSFSFEVIQHFKGYSGPMYAAIEPGCAALLVASDKPFLHVTGDEALSTSFEGNDKKQDTRDEKSSSLSAPVYKWSQDSEDITVKFQIPDDTSKANIKCEIKADSLNVSIGGNVLLSGELFAKVNSEESTWTCDGNSVEVVLVKQTQEHHWSSVVKGDDRGKYELVGEEAERVKEIHNRLEHLTSDKPVGDSRGNNMSYSDQQIEECDALPEDVEYIFRLDVTTGEVTHKVCLATHQWIFNATLNPSLPPAFCIRHDVDALLWQPKAQASCEDNWTHVGTFNALGYVQAAKRDRKFSTCAPNMSFATLCDCTRHVYIYQQAEKEAKHASQHVVTLSTPDNEILGLQASNGRVFVLTKQSLHVVTMK